MDNRRPTQKLKGTADGHELKDKAESRKAENQKSELGEDGRLRMAGRRVGVRTSAVSILEHGAGSFDAETVELRDGAEWKYYKSGPLLVNSPIGSVGG